MRSVLYWSPRIIGLAFAAFLSIFAFGALRDAHGTGDRFVHFVMSLLPTLIVLAALAVAWRRPPVGAVVFLGFAVWYVATSWGQFPVSTYVVIAGPPGLVALLFLVDWRYSLRPPSA